MNTLKSTAVILVLAGVLYGVYTALNKPDAPPPAGMTAQEVDEIAPPEIDFGGMTTQSAKTLPAPPDPLKLLSESRSPADLPGTASQATSGSIYAQGSQPADAPPSNSPPSTTPPPSAGDATAQGKSPTRQSSFERPDAAESPADSSVAAFSLRRDLALAEQHVAGGKFRSALALLTPHHGQPELSSAEREQLLAWLDALAAKVIYSREHLLEQPYVVRGSETLFEIAERVRVPAELLQNINGVNDPRVLLPGTELKIVPGPLRAEVGLATGELTVFVGDLYAGRFPFALGNEPPPPGQYDVKDRRPDRTYVGPDGRTIAANDPVNPYGQCWIDLGATACIHGSPSSSAPGTQTLGCISLSPQDARDVYAMLAQGASVVVRR